MERRSILLFDVMDTLVHEPFHREMPAFFGMTLAELTAAKHPTAWIDFELGRASEAEFLASFFRDGRDFDRAGFVDCVRAAYRWLPGMEELLAALCARGHVLHALSNYPEWYRMVEERLGLSRYLAWSFVSCRTGVRKPDERAFTGAAAELGVPPGECLLIDDRAENVAAARAQGLQALRFTSAYQLGLELAQRGLLAAG
ncbi:MAG: HAD-IA family hydrolase [Planctomycetes bacterium]|nr:HAD-IA family hydrolase [Planctomycetota bacterium]